MKPQLTPLRKAAILLASLDDETADALVAQMEPEDAGRVRREMADLGEIGRDVELQVLMEFRSGGHVARDPYPSGIELDKELAEKLARPVLSDSYSSPAPEAETPPPFRFLHEAQADTLVEYLQRERPQTIAAVVSHLSPTHAADVIDRLAPAVQAQVLRRLAELDETDPAVLRDIERHLESRISDQIRSHQRRQAGLQALGAILSAAAGRTRRDIVTNLMQHDSALAERLGFDRSGQPAEIDGARGRRENGHVQFADLATYDRQRLRQLLDAAPAEVVVLALAGADGEFVERAVACLTAKRGKLLRRALAHLGPTRLSDVEEAQNALTELARGLGLGASPARRLAAART
jgi:flagellar motor switch protein FliG